MKGGDGGTWAEAFADLDGSMKILIYSRALFAPLVGGTETIVILLARGLAESEGGISGGPPAITVVTPTQTAESSDSGLPFHLVRKPSLRILFRLFCKADLIHIAGPSLFPVVLAVLLRKTVVVEHHGFQTICPNGQLLYQPTQVQCSGHFMAKRYHKCVRCNSKMGTLGSLKVLLLTFPASLVLPARLVEYLSDRMACKRAAIESGNSDPPWHP